MAMEKKNAYAHARTSKRVKGFVKSTSIKVRESYNLFRPNNSLKTIGYDILNIVTVPAYKIFKML